MATTIDARVVYACNEGFAAPEGTARRDDLFRGSHVLVSRYPEKFSPADTPPDERPSEMQGYFDRVEAEERERNAAEAAKRERQARANRLRLTASPVMVATQDVVCEVDNRPATVSRGSTVHADDPLVAQFPDLFEPAKR